MDFYIKRSALEPELNRLQSILERKSQIPIVENVHISSESGHALRLAATNLETTLVCTAVADQIVKHGAVCLPARRLFDLVKLCADTMIHIEGDGTEQAKITAARAKFKIPSFEADAFPEIPTLKDTVPLQFPTKLIKSLISGVEFAIAPEEDVQFLLCGVKFESNSEGTKMVAADGHRLSIAQTTGSDDLQLEDLDVLIPKKALEDLSKLTDSEHPIKVAVEGNYMFFQTGGRTLATRLLIGDFPSYTRIIDDTREGLTDVIFKSAELTQAIKRAAFAADEHSNAVLFDFQAEEVILTASTSKAGEATESVPIEYAGAPFKINLNAKYLLEYLAAVDAAKVHLGVRDGRSSVLFRSQSNGIGYACVVMPMEPPD